MATPCGDVNPVSGTSASPLLVLLAVGAAAQDGGAPIPLWLKLSYTAFVCLLVPVYWVKYGPGNFLWFSDIALLATGLALWLESRFLASMMAVGVLLPEVVWNLSYVGRLVGGVRVGGLADYMFDRRKPLYLRALSLFHVALPAILLWLLHRLGYDPRAWIAQTLLAWVVLPATYLLTEPAENVNWVFGPGNSPQHRVAPLAYLAFLMVFFPLAVYLPTHLVLQMAF
jgi:hypothetical protein